MFGERLHTELSYWFPKYIIADRMQKKKNAGVVNAINIMPEDFC
jgi:hypothetical protein